MSPRECRAAAIRAVFGPPDQSNNHFLDLPIAEIQRWLKMARELDLMSHRYFATYHNDPEQRRRSRQFLLDVQDGAR